MNANNLQNKYLYGKPVAETLYTEITNCKELKCKPSLCVIQVTYDKASDVYVRQKQIAADKLGFNFLHYKLPTDVSESHVKALITECNNNPAIHGIILQLPIPPHLNQSTLINCINHTKDVDGLTKYNQGKLFSGDTTTGFLPCTPHGCMKLLNYYNIPVSGKHAVVMGRSTLVGRPLALLLQYSGATVSVIHRTYNAPEQITQQADLLFVAIGHSEYVKASYIKPDAYVIDIGINLNSEGKILGDVNNEAVQVAKQITPVPRGIGPITVAMLMYHTYLSARRTGIDSVGTPAR